MTQSGLGGFGTDEHRAQQVLAVLREFVAEFPARQEPGQLRQLIEGQELDGGILQQAPEDFTERHLVEPCLDALGYSVSATGETASSTPSVRPQPSHFPKVEQKRPDYELCGVHETLTCIVEVKAINREAGADEGPATRDIQAYLEDNTFCKHAQSQPPGVLVGIGTDGVAWTLWVKDLAAGTVYDDVVTVEIRDALRALAASALAEGTDGATARDARLDARAGIRKGLVEAVARANLVDMVGECVGRVAE